MPPPVVALPRPPALKPGFDQAQSTTDMMIGWARMLRRLMLALLMVSVRKRMLQLPLMLVVKKTWAMLLARTGAGLAVVAEPVREATQHTGAASATEHAVSSAGPALADEPVGEAAEHTAAASATEHAVVPHAPQGVLLQQLPPTDISTQWASWRRYIAFGNMPRR